MFALVCILGLSVAASGQIPEGDSFTNSIGMEFVESSPVRLRWATTVPLPEEIAGQPWRASGDADERPVHEVKISRPFFLGVVEVTNAPFEAFDPAHKALRGRDTHHGCPFISKEYEIQYK